MAVYTISQGEKITASILNAYAMNAGLVYITQGTFTGVTSAAPLAVTSVWNSTYDNYKIQIKAQGSANANVFMRYYTGTNTLNSDSNYSMSGYNASGATLTGVAETSQSRTYFGYVFGASVDYAYFDIDVYSPNLATETGMRNFETVFNAGGPWVFSSSSGHYKNSVGQYTGFQIYPDAGSILGSYIVYGYRKA
jgi:hypothetical protein